jgi:hypothetical protein
MSSMLTMGRAVLRRHLHSHFVSTNLPRLVSKNTLGGMIGCHDRPCIVD